MVVVHVITDAGPHPYFRTLIEAGVITDPDLDLFFPSIAVNTNGTVVIGCNGSSINVNVSCYAIVGRTLNGITTFTSPLLLQAGATSYHGDDELLLQFEELPAFSRWGDYSATSVDPSDSSRFWTIQMYPSDAGNPDVWSTQITELLTSTAPLLSISPSGTNVMISWTSSATGYQLQSAASLASPVIWSGRNEARGAREVVRWSGLRDLVHHFLDRLPLDPPPAS